MNPAPESQAAASRVAFLGFSDVERHALTRYLRLRAEREPRYTLVYTLTDADFLVADADHAPSVQLAVVTERLAETVFIGAQAPAGAAAALRRPIDALQLMSALDALPRAVAATPVPALARPEAVPQAGPETPAAAGGPVAQPLSTVVRAAQWVVDIDLDLAAAPVAALAHGSLPRAAVTQPPAPARPVLMGPPPPPRALLVDDSSIALRYLASRLMPWGVLADAVSSSAAALTQLAARRYDLVFLDLELGTDSPMDGLALCRHIKRMDLAPDATVVMVSAHHSEIDRARGALALCDAYLAKPLKAGELSALLQRQGLFEHDGAPAATSATAPAHSLR